MASRPVTNEASLFSLAAGAGRDALIWLASITALLTFAYWEVLQDTSLEWAQPQYSHGWIIPVIALFILWSRRPNSSGAGAKGFNPTDYARPAIGALAALAAVGMTIGSTLLAGVGLAGLCLVALAMGLWGQPFTRYSRGAEDKGPAALWVLTGLGAVLVAIGWTAVAMGVRTPVLHPGFYQVFGLLGMAYGGIGVALFEETRSSKTLGEVVFGVALLVLSLAAWSSAVQVDMAPLARYSFIAALVGLFTAVGGLRLLKWAGPPVGFLFFMFPLPTVVEGSVLNVLQKIAVIGSEIVFTVMGATVIREGSRLDVEGIPMNVIEACSGLSMSTILIAMAIAMVLLINRPWWDKLIVLISAIPVALVSNIFRIVATWVIWVLADKMVSMDAEATGPFRDMLHNYAGIVLMMPFALGLYWLEFKLLSMLTVEEESLESRGAEMIGGVGAPRVP